MSCILAVSTCSIALGGPAASYVPSHPNDVGSGNIDLRLAQLNITPKSDMDIVEGQCHQVFRVSLPRSVLLCNENFGEPFIENIWIEQSSVIGNRELRNIKSS